MIVQPVPRVSRLPQGLSSLRHRNFRLFWFGQFVSLAGTWMQTVAQGWLLLQLTNDPVALGALAATQFMPVLVLGLFGGVVADSVPKRRALVATQVVSGALALILGLLVLANSVQVWHIFVLAALLGVASAFDMPIRQSFVVEMVGREDLVNAVALNSAVFNGTRIIGPAIAGILIAGFGLAPCFLINAASYIAVIVGLVMMREEDLGRPPPSALERTPRSVLHHLAEGLRYVRDTPTTFLAIAIMGVIATAALNFMVLLPLLAKDVLGGGATEYGFLSSAAGLGSLMGALALAFGRPPTFRRLLVGGAAVGVSMVGLALSRWLLLSLGLMVLCGWGLIAMAATTNTIIQLTTPDHLRGRVVSVYTTVFAGSTPVGGLFSGAVAAAAGTPTAFMVAGVISLLAIGAAVFIRWRQMRVTATAIATLLLIVGLLATLAACQAPGPLPPASGAATGAASEAPSDGSALTPEPLTIAAVQQGPHLVFQNVKRDRDYANVSLAPLAAPDGPRVATGLVCERVHYAAAHGLCLAAHHTGESTYTADVFGFEFHPTASVQLPGAPTMATVSADGRYGAASVFLSTDDDEDPFPTQTVLIDMATGSRIADLEELALTKDGAAFGADGVDFSGATFAADSDRFYASVRTGGNTYLVRGTISGRGMEAIRQNVSAPSLSPDQTRIVFAKIISTIGPTFRLTVLDLATMTETPLAEQTSVEEQVVWLDDSRVLYGRGTDIWSVPADGTGEPVVFVHDALSPAVVR